MTAVQELTRTLDRLHGAALLCVGDVMLDRFIYGRVDRISPEAPIPAFSTEREARMLGGAGNVVRNLLSLGASASFASVVGADLVATQLTALVGEEERLVPYLITERGRISTKKTRYVAASQQLLRSDSETKAPIRDETAQKILDLILPELATHQALIVAGQIAASAVVLRTELYPPNYHIPGLGLCIESAPDGRIYLVWNGENSLTVINEPNASGEACNFVVGQVQLLDTSATGLPDQCKRYHDSDPPPGMPAVQYTQEQLLVWPVPTDGVLHVRTSKAGQVRIVDALGRTVATQLTGENRTAYVDLTLAAPGAYAVQWLAPGSPPVCRWVVKR